MKAWKIYDKYCECNTVIVFADTRSKAVYNAMNFTDEFEDCSWTDMRARRFPEYDQYYAGKSIIDFWYDLDHRVRLVKDFGWSCLEPDFYCEDCPAKPYCPRWEHISQN